MLNHFDECHDFLNASLLSLCQSCLWHFTERHSTVLHSAECCSNNVFILLCHSVWYHFTSANLMRGILQCYFTDFHSDV